MNSGGDRKCRIDFSDKEEQNLSSTLKNYWPNTKTAHEFVQDKVSFKNQSTGFVNLIVLMKNSVALTSDEQTVETL